MFIVQVSRSDVFIVDATVNDCMMSRNHRMLLHFTDVAPQVIPGRQLPQPDLTRCRLVEVEAVDQFVLEEIRLPGSIGRVDRVDISS